MSSDVFLAVVLVLSIVSLIQILDIRRRLKALDPDRLERRLSDLGRELRESLSARSGAAGAVSPSVEPSAAPVRPVPVAAPVEPVGSGPPPLPASVTSRPVVREAPRPVPAAPAPAAPPVPSTSAPSAPPSRFVQSVQDILMRIWRWLLVGEEYRPKGVTMEYAVATTWLVRTGIVAVVFGIGFFLKWSIDRNLLGPTARVAMSLVFGLAMLGAGLRMLGRRWNLLGQGFTGGGLAVLYFGIYALGPLYALVDSRLVVFALMILVTVSAGVLALYANSMLVAIFGIIGGFLTPVLLHTDSPNLPALYGYLVLLNLGILGIAYARPWRLLGYLGFVFTWVLYLVVRRGSTDADFAVTLAFLCCFFAAQSTLVWIYNLRRGLASTVLELIHMILNAALFAGAAYGLIHDAAGRPWPAAMTLGLALYYVLHVAVFLARGLKDRGLLITLIALAGVFTTLTMPLALARESLTIAWALQALMFVWLGRRLSSHFLRQLGFVVFAITMVRLAAFEFPRFDTVAAPPGVMAAYWSSMVDRLWTFGIAIGSIAAAFLIERKAARDPAGACLPDTPDVAPAGLARNVFFWSTVVLLFGYLHVEFFTMFGYMPLWRPAVLTLLWCAAGAAFLALYLESGSPVHFGALCVFLGGALVKTLLVDLAGWGIGPGGYFEAGAGPMHALSRWIGFGAVLGLLAWVWRTGRARGEPVAPRVFGYAALALLWLYATLEAGTFLRWSLPDFRAGGVSVLWTLFALAFVAGGIWRSDRPVRLAGLLLFAVVMAKVFLADLRHMPSAYRVIAFLVVGALLLLGSFAYLRAGRKFTTPDGEDRP